MPVATFPLGPLQTNSYLIHNAGQAVAVDVGGEPAPMLESLTEHKRPHGRRQPGRDRIRQGRHLGLPAGAAFRQPAHAHGIGQLRRHGVPGA